MQLGTDSITIASTGTTRVPAIPSADDGDGFFGANGPSWHDIVDAINPLEHIPFVSEWFDSATDHTPSAASKLAGGALLGGPLGLVASIANEVFASATGHTIDTSVVASLTGEEEGAGATELAANDAKATSAAAASDDTATETADAAPVEPVAVSNQLASNAAAVAPQQFASAAPLPAPASDKAVLSLYGGSPASAHQSYKKAQMLPYLHDVSVSQVL